MSNTNYQLDDCIAYHGLLGSTKTDADIQKAAREQGIDGNALISRVAQLRAASHRLVQARREYVEQTREDYALLQGVAQADAAYSDRRYGSIEMDIFNIANRVTRG